MDYDTRVSLKADIAAHVLENGSHRWNEVKQRYPQVSSATFWRYVGAAKAAAAAANSGNSSAEPENTDFGQTSNFETTPEFEPRFAYLTSLRGNDVVVELASIAADVERLRDYGLDSAGNVVRPHAFLASITLRQKILEFGLAAIHDIYDLQHQQRFYTRMIEVVVASVPPEDQARVLKELLTLERESNIQREEGPDFRRRLDHFDSTPPTPGSSV
jgi:hypothetical protein